MFFKPCFQLPCLKNIPHRVTTSWTQADKPLVGVLCSKPMAGLTRKKKAGAWSPLAFFYPKRVASYRWSKKNNILVSLCLASYLAVNWLQKLKTKLSVYYAEFISLLICVCLCVYGISVWFIYSKTKLPFCKISAFVPYT